MSFSDKLNSIKTLLFNLLHPEGSFFRLFIAFAAGMFFRILIMDFSYLSDLILESVFTEKISILLVHSSVFIFDLLNIPVRVFGRNLAIYDTVGVLVDSTCLGYRGIILFSVFILVYYGHFIKKLIYIVMGFVVLEFGNVIRICILAYVQYCCPERFDFVHFYFTKFIFYSLILILWILWVEKFSKSPIVIQKK